MSAFAVLCIGLDAGVTAVCSIRHADAAGVAGTTPANRAAMVNELAWICLIGALTQSHRASDLPALRMRVCPGEKRYTSIK